MAIDLIALALAKQYTDKSVKEVAAAGGQVQSDWNQTNTAAVDYIKNKPSSLPASDVSAWAKQPSKPIYTASEVGAIPAPTDVKVGQYFKVSSVANGKITGIEAVDPWILSDEATGIKYKLSVVNGKLTMTESEV